jgi:electron transport complex protein RnfB
MHTVVEPWCIGCGLCPPACPVDCIDMVAPRGPWSEALKRAAGLRARRRQARLSRVQYHQPADRRKLIAEILKRR